MLPTLDCLALCLAPHAIYYFATELHEYDAIKSATYGAIASICAAIVKGMLTAIYTPVNSDILWLRMLISAAITCLTDVAGLWYAISKFSHRNISNFHKFQAVGLGWAAADAVLLRMFPILSGAWSPQFDLGHVISAIQANLFIVHMLSMSAMGVLFWGKKSRPAGVMFVLRLLVLLHAVVPAVISVLEQLRYCSQGQAAVLQAGGTALLAAMSLGMWQHCNTKSS